MAASERLKTSRKAVTDAKKQLVIFVWPGVQIYWTNGCKPNKNRLHWRESTTIYVSITYCAVFICGGILEISNCWQRAFAVIAPKAFCGLLWFHKKTFFNSASRLFFVEAASFVVSWKQAVSQDLHNQGHKCYTCFTSQQTSSFHGFEQSLNIHGTIAAWSHFLLSNKTPVYAALFLGQLGCRVNCLLAASQTLYHLHWFHSC